MARETGPKAGGARDLVPGGGCLQVRPGGDQGSSRSQRSDAYPVSFMCAWLEVSRSGYYAWRGAEPSQRSRDDTALIAVIKAVYEQARGNPGVRRMRAGLAALGHLVSHKRVYRLMQAVGLRGRHPQAWKRTTIGGDKPVPAPDLIGRDFTAALPDARWCGDVTYIKTWDGWAYLATVIDLYSRKVIGWAVAAHMRTSLITAALDMALAARKPPPGSSSILTAAASTHPRYSTPTARRMESGGLWEGQESATTMPYLNPSSRLTRKS